MLVPPYRARSKSQKPASRGNEAKRRAKYDDPTVTSPKAGACGLDPSTLGRSAALISSVFAGPCLR